ncbi:hypothetical protein [Vibrio parahaemolyticus]|uniref:hypothetical protein n=1 Tax=Vibrio parahaemolyticus TaxID=670 RepID=UPI0004D52F84|nr:hypothetical protein [Vibrio parahaemolyticus]EGQ8192687.1 hypothetical protein [Vibrio parahaemolyticus]EKB1990197.1 hypothetical protein [Vibrio parahaemolyticus]EME0133908.1 hypothetical protein [Vibrio parahaemolyticus]OAR41418.1 hypothetical protein EM55_012220 [Vibrio parahaemolyticus]OOQ78786.1 hypothetical protein BSR65_14280 [Vibrio parahaemolyticus]
MPAKVCCHKKFFFGNTNTNEFMDYEFIEGQDLQDFALFITSVLNGQSLHGRNKPSWTTPEGKVIATYQKANIWHYHSGPHRLELPTQTPNIRVINEGRFGTPAVIHYTWASEDVLVILAYSPRHNPFPLPSDKHNVLRTRLPTVIGGLPSDAVVDLQGEAVATSLLEAFKSKSNKPKS